jgi:putative addiction module killer protein
MPTVIKSDAFAEWIDNLRDRTGAAQVLRRLARLERGNPGSVAPVGEGVSELKIDFGPGYRVYWTSR